MSYFTVRDPSWDPVWSDPEIRDAYLAACADQEPTDDWADESDFLVPPGLDGHEAQGQFDAMLDIEQTVRLARAYTAQQDQAFDLTLSRAAAEPDVWVGPDPTLDPAWTDPRKRSVAAVRAHRSDLAVRSAAADIGARVRLSDNQVRNRAHRAAILRTRTPLLWAACIIGSVSEQNMAIAAELAASLPDDDTAAWAIFDAAIHDAATDLAPGRFRRRARAARERAHSESLSERHARAAAERRVCLDDTVDGMTYITAFIPAVAAHAIDRRLDDAAHELARQPNETRTRAQLRADAFVDLLTAAPVEAGSGGAGSGGAGSVGAGSGGAGGGGSRITATVNLTIPALTLLGRSDEPATLEGYGPIPLETARELAGEATSWLRVLTHPFTGTVLDVERRSYRVPADLRRWIGIRYPTCIFPGCNRPARECDLDHRQRWADGGTTSSTNLGPECPSHHPVKDETGWQLRLDAETGQLIWTSPTGYEIVVDPPPF
ncbi:MAG: HNH endonuclease [Microbacterium sp.]|nr:MAG: HNH endonuclease [Microbacterium sp.]